jgi:hypothetical protein
VSAERRIRRLRLEAPDERLVRRGALLVEDALATASLPGGDSGRLLLVRSLDLGRIRAGASPSSVALRLEARLREVAATAVWAGDPVAAIAPAAWFRDEVEAPVLLARRLARRQDATAWFWRQAVPAWKPEMALPEALRALVLAALETPAGVAAAVEVVRAVAEEGAWDDLAAGLAPADGVMLLRLSGWGAAAGPLLAGPAPVGELGAGLLAIVRRWVERWGARDARAVWMAAALMVMERPARVADVRLAGRARRVVAGVVERPALVAPSSLAGAMPVEAREGPSPLTPLPPTLPPSPGEGDPLPVVAEKEGEIGEERPADFSLDLVAGDGVETSGAREARKQSAVGAAVELAGEPTGFAGLFFLLPVLARLGIVEFLEEHPELGEAAPAARILDHVARRVGAAIDDPVRRVLEVPALPLQDFDFAVPARWAVLVPPGGARPAVVARGSRPGLHAFAPPGQLPLPLLDAWLTAARRWCRRVARIGLADLIRRPGLVTASRMHLDLTFELRRTDIRIRRAGLDLDPGWLPWFGRVVQIHYERLEVPHGRR